MKVWIVAFLFLSSVPLYSQTKDNDLRSLLDSINAFDPMENLYSQINVLEYANSQQYLKLRTVKRQLNLLGEFCIRQAVYKKIFDQLELGLMPDKVEVEPWVSLNKYDVGSYDQWSLFEAPPLGRSWPITIYLNESTNYDHEQYPVEDIGLALRQEDPILKKRYPTLFKMIKKGKVVFQMKPLTPMSLLESNIAKLRFPSYSPKVILNTAQHKQNYADDLLEWISKNLSPAIKRVEISRDVVADYMKIEKKAYRAPTIDEKINLRIRYIEFLKKKYSMLW
jgi:hypothetical protein